MAFSLQLQILQSGKEADFENLSKVERLQQEIWRDLIDASNEKGETEQAFYDVSALAEAAWENYASLYRRYIPRLRAQQTSLTCKDAYGIKRLARARRHMREALQEARLEAQTLYAAADILKDGLETDEEIFKVVVANHALINRSVKIARQIYNKSSAALNHRLSQSNM